MMSEKALVTGVVKRNRKALEEFYDRFAPVLLGLCLRYCGVRADAEDVLHDALIKILSNIEKYDDRPDGTFEGWVKRITVNTALNYLRDKAKVTKWNEASSFEIPDEEPEEEVSLIQLAMGIERDQILGMICELPSGYRTVFNMYVFEEYSHKEIADLLNCTESTSKTQLFKARAILRKKVTEVMSKQNVER